MNQVVDHDPELDIIKAKRNGVITVWDEQIKLKMKF